ncbi:MAG: hypothetical protein EBR82_31895 [Caulobacteraceae bacterium]|nr:hypothetical protein [Caulobacteraceae bacterium]
MITIKSIATTSDERIIIGEYYEATFRLSMTWKKKVPVSWSVYPSEHVLEDKTNRPIERIFEELEELVSDYSE